MRSSPFRWSRVVAWVSTAFRHLPSSTLNPARNT